MKLDGLPAGVLLATRFLIPAVLAMILIRNPEKLLPVSCLSLAFFGFFFIDSSVTIQTNTGGAVLFGIVPLAGVLIPVIVVIGHFLGDRYGRRDDKC